ncbi:alpha/beta hydrolase [Microbaculum marinum]|uniref:Alpha/beta hydrolase n=1 Tax=Microbaculum marinum TaxID=1764581 RepID=A0AAW9RVB9_9HYPH
MTDAAPAGIRQDEAGAPAEWRDVLVTAQDGLRIHVRDYPGESRHLPVVCLPGLTRNGRDFHELARFLSTHKDRPRRVLAVDFRGRGGSGYDPNWKNYTPSTELADVLDVLTACRVDAACFVGTSRGGLVTMLMAAARPSALRAAILNDIGPEIEGRGLLRIKNLLSATRDPGSWEQATDTLRRAYEQQFPAVDDAGWASYTRKTFADRDGRPVRDFDPKLMKTLENVDFNQPLQTIWPQFDGLAKVPLMVVRGEHSDILSEKTLAGMTARRTNTEVVIAEGSGHAPMLTEPDILGRIAAFIAAAEDR